MPSETPRATTPAGFQIAPPLSPALRAIVGVAVVVPGEMRTHQRVGVPGALAGVCTPTTRAGDHVELGRRPVTTDQVMHAAACVLFGHALDGELLLYACDGFFDHGALRFANASGERHRDHGANGR